MKYAVQLVCFMRDFEVFTAVKVHIEVFWGVTLCSFVVGYEHFGALCCFQFRGEDWLHFTLKMEAAWSSETSISYYNTTQ